MRSSAFAPGEVLDRVVRTRGLGFRGRGYRVIYWRPGVSNSELDSVFGTDQRECAFDFARLMFEQGFTAEVYLCEVQALSVMWLSGRATDWHERRYVLLQSFTRAPPESVRDVVEFPGGAA